MGSISFIKFDDLGEFYFSGLYFFFQVSSFKAVLYSGLYFFYQIWWFRRFLLLWDLFLFSSFIILNSFTTLGSISKYQICWFWRVLQHWVYVYYQIWWFRRVLLLWALFLFSSFIIQNSFTTLGSISFNKFDDLGEFYYTGLYFFFQVSSFKTVLLLWALFLLSNLMI